MKKIIKKILPVMFSVMLLFAALPTLAEAKTYEVKPGDKVQVVFNFSDVYGCQGEVAFSDYDMIAKASVSIEGSGSKNTNGYKFAFAPEGGEAGSGKIVVNVTVSSSAKAGDTCTVSIKDYLYGDADYNDVSGSLATHTIKIVKADDGGNDKPTSPETDDKEKVDYTELKKQIEAAESLTKDGYTKASWDALQEALAAGKEALSSKDQAVVDAAAQAIADAIAALVKMDYSRLQEAINSADELTSSDEFMQLIKDLINAMNNGVGLLNSDDQAAVDAAADEIFALIEQLKAMLAAFEAEDEVPVVPEEPQDDPVATEPEGEFCNIPMHKVWPILFFISLALNIVLVILLVGKRKSKGVDDTPVVNYNIDDDK